MSTSSRAELERYHQASRYLDEGLIRPRPVPADPLTRRAWMEAFLPALGHPERAFPAIHVAGTSGKGSVATMIAQILRAAGISTGLHVSPYLQVASEKLWVDGHYASAREFAALVDWVRPIAEAWRRPEVPLHGMASVAVALEHFRRAAVEIGVIEAGVGGRDDLTNVLQTRVAVISAVGLDHLQTLGPDLASIARHKAGIIRPGCRAVVLEGPAEQAARHQADEQGVPLRVLSRASFGALPAAAPGQPTRLRFSGRRFQLDGVELGMLGAFQAENAALAVAALEELDPEGSRIDETAVRRGLREARLPGRLELIRPSPGCPCAVLLDGAHNPDKLAALLSALQPGAWPRLHVVYGALHGRAPDEQVCRLAALAEHFVITEPHVYEKPPRPAAAVAAVVSRASRTAPLLVPSPTAALQAALARAAPGDLVVVTGSLYLCGELRERWYPGDEVVLRRQSWWA